MRLAAGSGFSSLTRGSPLSCPPAVDYKEKQRRKYGDEHPQRHSHGCRVVELIILKRELVGIHVRSDVSVDGGRRDRSEDLWLNEQVQRAADREKAGQDLP